MELGYFMIRASSLLHTEQHLILHACHHLFNLSALIALAVHKYIYIYMYIYCEFYLMQASPCMSDSSLQQITDYMLKINK